MDDNQKKQLEQTKQVIGVVGGLLYGISQGSYPLDVYVLMAQGQQFLKQFKDQLVAQLPKEDSVADGTPAPAVGDTPVVQEAANAAPQV